MVEFTESDYQEIEAGAAKIKAVGERYSEESAEMIDRLDFNPNYVDK